MPNIRNLRTLSLRLGAVETYQRVKAAYPEKVMLNLPCATRELPPAIMEELRKQVEES